MRASRAIVLLATLATLVAQPVARAGAPEDDLYRRAERLCIDNRREESLVVAFECLEAARRDGDRHREAWTLDLIGNNYYGLERPEDALRYFEASLTAMRDAGDPYGEAIALKDAGIMCRSVGRYDDGITYLFQALELFRAQDDPETIVSALGNLGQAYANVGARRFAYDAFREGREIAERRCDPAFVADLEVRMAFLQLDQDDPASARDLFRHAIDICGEIPRREGLRGWAEMGLSEALYQLGDVDHAVAIRLRALDVERSRRKWSGAGSHLIALARYVEARDPALALRYARESLELFERHGALDAWYSRLFIARQYRRQGQLDRAIDLYQQAIEGVESVRGGLGSETLRAGFYETNQIFYHELIAALVERGDAARAFGVFERAKARAMLDAIAEAKVDAEADLSPELRERRERLVARIAELRERLVAPEVSVDERRRSLAELDQTEEGLDSFVDEIKRENPKYAALRYPAPLSLDATRALLGDDTALVAYSTTRERVVAFVVTATTFDAVRLAETPEALEARVRNYTDLMAQDADGWRDIGRRLYASLVDPIRDRIGPGVARLVVVPDGVLYELPFETLPIETGDGAAPRFLIEDFAVSYAPSATVLSELSAPGWAPDAPGRADMFVLADPVSERTEPGSVPDRLVRVLYEDERLAIAPVPSTRVEADAISRYAQSGSSVLTGADATERRVKEGGLDRYRVLHFATHGLVSERAPYRSALVLGGGEGEDGFLQVREIYRLRLRTDLVVLSACQTARAGALDGDGVQSLAVAFLHAGARSVVASLWNVNDDRTAVFMEAFYRHLATGESKTDALRRAKLELIADPATSSPRIWAPFVLVGEASRPVPISEPSRVGWWASAAAILGVGLLALVVLTRRRGRSSGS